MAETSTKPYLIRAIYEWCNDNGHTPYLAVEVDERAHVPREYVKDGEIVLNVSPMATQGLEIGNELIVFQARFGGVARQLSIPVDMVSAIYASESGHGMAFDVVRAPVAAPTEAAPAESDQAESDQPVAPHRGRSAPRGARQSKKPVAVSVVPAGQAAGAEPAPPREAPADAGASKAGRSHLTRVK